MRLRPRHQLLALALAVGLSACAAPDQATAPEALSLEAWGSERIELPPGFAPELPTGEELLLFAPGMFDAEAEDYWSYAFVLRIDESPLLPVRLTEILELYYDGLIRAVASERGEAIEGEPATVSLRRSGARSYEASIDLVDAFVTMERIELRLLISVDDARSGSSSLEVQASPRAADHRIWIQLAAAAASLEL